MLVDKFSQASWSVKSANKKIQFLQYCGGGMFCYLICIYLFLIINFKFLAIIIGVSGNNGKN